MSVMIKFKGISNGEKEFHNLLIAQNRVSAISAMPDENACCIHTDNGNFGVLHSIEDAAQKLGFPVSNSGPMQ